MLWCWVLVILCLLIRIGCLKKGCTLANLPDLSRPRITWGSVSRIQGDINSKRGGRKITHHHPNLYIILTFSEICIQARNFIHFICPTEGISWQISVPAILVRKKIKLWPTAVVFDKVNNLWELTLRKSIVPTKDGLSYWLIIIC